MLFYHAEVFPDNDQFSATIRDFPGLKATAENHDLLIVALADQIKVRVDRLIAEGKPVPSPSAPQPDESLVALSGPLANEVARHNLTFKSLSTNERNFFQVFVIPDDQGNTEVKATV